MPSRARVRERGEGGSYCFSFTRSEVAEEPCVGKSLVRHKNKHVDIARPVSFMPCRRLTAFGIFCSDPKSVPSGQGGPAQKQKMYPTFSNLSYKYGNPP